MNNPKSKSASNGGEPKPDDATDEEFGTATTMRLKTLKLEGELWPNEAEVDPEEDTGVDPYNTGIFNTNK